VPAPERIAVFDNDGTLWTEKPVPFQLVFAFDQVKAMAPQHPSGAPRYPLPSLLKGDKAGLASLRARRHPAAHGRNARRHDGPMSSPDRSSNGLRRRATHRDEAALHRDGVQPMLELLDYLRANGFKTFIVSGGGVEFMRPWTECVYGIPPEQVVGSSGKLKLETRERAAGCSSSCPSST
jgi:FMN phosphatase YigB (HAD superfamily)